MISPSTISKEDDDSDISLAWNIKSTKYRMDFYIILNVVWEGHVAMCMHQQPIAQANKGGGKQVLSQTQSGSVRRWHVDAVL